MSWNGSPESLPKKLYLGKNKTNDNIYAHMRLLRGTYSVQCWSRDPANGTDGITLQHSDVGQQTIIHPFNKTYTKDRRSLTAADQERLDILVKWYFIAAGIATNIVLRETPSYPTRLVSTLHCRPHGPRSCYTSGLHSLTRTRTRSPSSCISHRRIANTILPRQRRHGLARRIQTLAARHETLSCGLWVGRHT
jgi:hypothetical protein